MKRKKLFALLMTALMTASVLTGCGSSDTPSASSSAAAPAESSVASEASSEASSEAAPAETELAEDVQAIVDRGVLRVGVKNAVLGFGYQDELTGEYEGMEIELAKKIAEYLGVDVEFTAVTAATRTELLDYASEILGIS